MAITEQTTTGGVSFELTSEQRDLRALAHEFAEKEIRPKAAEYDEHSTHPVDVIAKAHELGLMNLHVPESLGGPGHMRKDHIAEQTFYQGVTTHDNRYYFPTLGQIDTMYSDQLQKPAGQDFWKWIETATIKL